MTDDIEKAVRSYLESQGFTVRSFAMFPDYSRESIFKNKGKINIEGRFKLRVDAKK